MVESAKMPSTIQMVCVEQVASVVRGRHSKVLIIDCRSFLEYNDSHIQSSKNVYCSKLMKRRLQQGKVSLKDLLVHCHVEADESYDVIVYDHSTSCVEKVAIDSFVFVLLKKLSLNFNRVHLVNGGFLEFHSTHPELCEEKGIKCPTLTSLSQPCLPITNIGPTRILPYLYLGSEEDANNKDLLQSHNIMFELNVSTNCPKPDFIQDSNFLRIPVNDSHNERLLPFFQETCQFVEKAKEASGCVLIHCLAGISRSPTVAIAYVMRNLKLSCEEAYRYVKAKRATISPNFNFLGQLLEYEKQLQSENVLEKLPDGKETCTPIHERKAPQFLLPLSTHSPKQEIKISDLSPTTALAQLNFDGPSGKENWVVSTESSWQQTSTFNTESIDITSTFKSSTLSDINFVPCKSSLPMLRKVPSPVKLDLRPKFFTESIATPSVFDSTWFSRNKPSLLRTDSMCTSGIGSEMSESDVAMEGHGMFDDGSLDEGVFCEGASPQPSPSPRVHLEGGNDCSMRLRHLTPLKEELKPTLQVKLRESTTKGENVRSPEKRKSCELSSSNDNDKSEKRRSFVSSEDSESKGKDDKVKQSEFDTMRIDDYDKENFFGNKIGFVRSIGGRFSGRTTIHKKLEMLMKPEGLYRVQSCPSSINADEYQRILASPESPEPLSDSAVLKLRISPKSQPTLIRNRYSCVNIEFNDSNGTSSSAHSSTSTLALISVQ